MEYDSDSLPPSPPSLKQRLRRSLCLYCCLPTSRRLSLSSDKSTLLRASSAWVRSKADNLPEFSDIMGRRRRHSPSSSSYDPLSYALNFDDSDEPDEAPHRSFSVSRVPPLKAVPETTCA